MNYIIPFNPKIIDNNELNELEHKLLIEKKLTAEEINLFLSFVCYKTRHYINPDMNDFTLKCDLAQSIIYNYLNKFGINIKLCATHRILNQVLGHSFVVVKINLENGTTKDYLIDPTYIQFFKKEKCSNDLFLVLNDKIYRTPDPGYFINKSDYELIMEFNNNGFAELTNEFAKIYGDSFYLTRTGITITDYLNTPISGEVYKNAFFKGEENPTYDAESLKKFNI